MTEEQAQTAHTDIKRLEGMIRENTKMTLETAEMTRGIHQILLGQPEYKRPGLVEIVDRHEKLIIRGGGAFCTILGLWELIKAVWLHV